MEELLQQILQLVAKLGCQGGGDARMDKYQVRATLPGVFLHAE